MNGPPLDAPPSDLSLIGAVPAILGFRPEAMGTATLLDASRRVVATILYGGGEGEQLAVAQYAALAAAAREQVVARWAGPAEDPAQAQARTERMHDVMRAGTGVTTRTFAVLGRTVTPAHEPWRPFPLPSAATDGYVAAAELLLGAPADCPGSFEQQHRWRACALRDGIADAAGTVLPEAQSLAVADSAGWPTEPDPGRNR